MAHGSALDLDRFRAAPLAREPYDHLVLADFIRPEAQAAVAADFPAIDRGGSFPLSSLAYGNTFGAVIDELNGPEVRAAFEEKFAIDLTDRPTMVTARGMARARDGDIHVDSRTKLLTVLIYMNPEWRAGGDNGAGHLRVLRSADSLDDFAVEIPPAMGTMLAFRCAPNAWHGHKPFEGRRRSIQLNWVRDAGVVRREQWRHRLSAFAKRLMPQPGAD
jgi:hypothetical protein